MKRCINIILFLFLACISCSKEKKSDSRYINVSVTKNDTILFKKQTLLKNKYVILGAKNDINTIINAPKTSSQIPGNLVLGVYERFDSTNKLLIYKNDTVKPLPRISDSTEITSYVLKDEFAFKFKKINGLKGKFIELELNDCEGSPCVYFSYYFMDQNNDTLGYQHSYFINTESYVSIHYLNSTLESYHEMNQMIESMTEDLISTNNSN